MNGSNISAASTGLLHGIQYMDERRRRDKQDARQDRMDTLAEQRESRRAEIDGLTLQQKQAEMADYQADAPIRQQDRAEKQRQYDARLNRRDTDQLLMDLDKEWETTQSLDNSLRAINDRIGDGLDYVGSSVDPKTGKITIQRADPDTGLVYENTYASMLDLQDKTRAYLGDEEAWRANWQSRIEEAKKLVAKQEKEEADKREHGQKKEITELENDGKIAVAKIGADSRVAAADARAEGLSIMLGRGGAVPAEDAIKMQDAITRRLAVINKDRSLRKAPTEYKNALARHEAFPQYYGKPNPADYGFAQGTPAAAPKPAQQKKGPVPVIDFSQFRM